MYSMERNNMTETIKDEQIQREVKAYVTTMLNQMGGHSFLRMVGQYGPILTHYNSEKCEYSATIRVGKNDKNVNLVKMIYCRGKDLYRFEYYHTKGLDSKLLSKEDDLFCEDIVSSFERNTGLYCSL